MTVDDKEIQQVLDDLANHDLPSVEDIEDVLDKLRCGPIQGQRIYWYYKEDVEYAREYAFDPEEDEYGNEIPATEEQACAYLRQNPTHGGLCVPLPGQLIGGWELDINEVLVVVDRYPTEKCEPEARWVALNRLLTQENLIEVFVVEDEDRPLTLDGTLKLLGAEEKECPHCAVISPWMLPGPTRQ